MSTIASKTRLSPPNDFGKFSLFRNDFNCHSNDDDFHSCWKSRWKKIIYLYYFL